MGNVAHRLLRPVATKHAESQNLARYAGSAGRHVRQTNLHDVSEPERYLAVQCAAVCVAVYIETVIGELALGALQAPVGK